MPINLSGDTGITTPGVDSAGMPTSGGDPVIESGSNSDGEWVRWADGTQHCQRKVTRNVPTSDWASFTIYRAFFDSDTAFQMPLSFLSIPTVSYEIISATVYSPNTWIMQNFDPIDAPSESISSTQWGAVRLASSSARDTGDFTIGLTATGRWK